MILDDVRDKALEALQTAKARLDESDAYLQLKERYDSLSPIMQKSLLAVVGFFFTYLFLQIPMSYYDTGTENLAMYEENRDLVLDLYKVKRHALAIPPSAAPLEASDLESRARMAVTGARVQPEQIKGISFFDNAGARSSTFIPKNVTQSGVEVRLANLNLTQIVDIGHALSNMGSSKMIGLDVKPGTVAGNYFDVIFKVVSFNIPAPAPTGTAGGRRGN